MGLTRGQMLRQVQLPMAKRTIVVGINQCMMAALSMATIASLVNGPGLGKPVLAGPAGPQRRSGVGGGPRDRGDGDHARPHHHRGQRALDGRSDVASASGMSVMLTGVVLDGCRGGPPRTRAADSGCPG